MVHQPSVAGKVRTYLSKEAEHIRSESDALQYMPFKASYVASRVSEDRKVVASTLSKLVRTGYLSRGGRGNFKMNAKTRHCSEAFEEHKRPVRGDKAVIKTTVHPNATVAYVARQIERTHVINKLMTIQAELNALIEEYKLMG